MTTVYKHELVRALPIQVAVFADGSCLVAGTERDAEALFTFPYTAVAIRCPEGFTPSSGEVAATFYDQEKPRTRLPLAPLVFSYKEETALFQEGDAGASYSPFTCELSLRTFQRFGKHEDEVLAIVRKIEAVVKEELLRRGYTQRWVKEPKPSVAAA